jgi:hypothetical protein
MAVGFAGLGRVWCSGSHPDDEEGSRVGLDDLMSTETAAVAAATAAVFSPKTRGTLRKGAVYGVAGVLKVGDIVAGAARGVAHGVRGDGTPVSDAPGPVSDAPGPVANPAPGAPARRTGSTGSGPTARRAAASTKSAGSAAG